MTTRLRWSFVCSALALLAGPAAAEGVYKWVDAEGRTHFGSRPPVGQKTEQLNRQVGPSDAAPAQGNRSWQEQLDLSNQRRQQARDKEQAAAKTDQENQQRCLAARSALDTLDRERPVYRVNANGEREYLEDNQRQAIRDAATQRVATYCR